MNGLFIDTASQSHCVGIYDAKDRAIAEMSWQGERDETEKLIKNIDHVLKKTKIKPSDISEIISIAGPGPFSAIRIGVTTTNIFAYALDLKMGSVRMQDYWALRQPHATETGRSPAHTIMLMHAGTYSVSCTMDGKEKLLDWEEIWKFPDMPTLFFGDLTREEIDILQGKLKSKWQLAVASELVTWQDVIGGIRSVAEWTDNDQGIHPLYYRPPHITSPKHVS